tara:strand:- start:10 stop:345 length:336 start_codon:yes stop_codon:yes gene_type:complete
MATSTLLVNKGVNDAPDTPMSIYTSPSQGNGTIITSVTAANNSTSNKSYKAYIVNAGEAAINPQTPFRIVLWADIDLATGIDGQVIPPGGSLYVECNAADSIYFTVSGKET